MEYRFNAGEWNALTPKERAHRCRLWAAEAQELANRAPPDLKASYESIAKEWSNLAREIEQHSNLGLP